MKSPYCIDVAHPWGDSTTYRDRLIPFLKKIQHRHCGLNVAIPPLPKRLRIIINPLRCLPPVQNTLQHDLWRAVEKHHASISVDLLLVSLTLTLLECRYITDLLLKQAHLLHIPRESINEEHFLAISRLPYHLALHQRHRDLGRHDLALTHTPINHPTQRGARPVLLGTQEVTDREVREIEVCREPLALGTLTDTRTP